MSGIVGVTNPCFNPQLFKPGGTLLLKKEDWALIQLFLVSAERLPLNVDKFPDPNAIPIFKVIHDASGDFKSNTLPKSLDLATSLYDYGRNANATFLALVQLLSEQKPDKDVIRTLFGRLIAVSSGYQTKAQNVFDETTTYHGILLKQKFLLDNVVKDEVASLGGLAAQVQILTATILAKQTDIQAAQAAILSDKEQIDRTKYYSWIPLVGTIVAIAMIISSNKDILAQCARIQTDVGDIQNANTTLAPLNAKVAQLTFAQSFNTELTDKLAKVLPAIEVMMGVWGAINKELSKVLENINNASDTKDVPCLAAISLTTAANEWHDVANDAHNYMLEYYLMPEQQAA